MHSCLRYMMGVCLTVLLFATVASAQTDVDQIITNAIAKLAADKQTCKSYTNSAIKKEFKYDGDYNPKEVRTLTMKVYHVDSVESAEVLAMDIDGEPVAAKKIRDKVAEMNKKWREEQEDDEKGSRDNYVDPMTEAGRADYSYELVATRDSVFATIPGAVTEKDSSGQPITVDEAVEQLRSFYVIEATSSVEDQKHIKATYWIDSETFGVLRLAFRPAKLPTMVHRLDFQLDYELIDLGGESVYMPSRLELKGKAGFLFFKGHFGVIETYFDYMCDPDLTATPSAMRYYYGDMQKES